MYNDFSSVVDIDALAVWCALQLATLQVVPALVVDGNVLDGIDACGSVAAYDASLQAVLRW